VQFCATALFDMSFCLSLADVLSKWLTVSTLYLYFGTEATSTYPRLN